MVADPATGRECTFGHEHGRDPRGSDLYAWVAAHFAAAPFEAYAGIPFGAATEALDAFADANPGVVRRQEDHVGYKVEFENDVPLTNADGALGVTCDYLVRVHQGTHSPDALSNNGHELLYASRCSDGTEIISNIVSRFGAPGAYTRGCDPTVTVTTSDNGYPAGPGQRLIPDRACMESGFLVPPGRTTSVWAAYELWNAQNELRTTDRVLASYEAGFGVFNPSRYGNPGPGDRPHARRLPRGRAVRRSRQRRRVRRGDRQRDGRVRRPALTVRRHAPRHVPARHDAVERRRPGPVVDRPVRRQRLAATVPGRDLPARRHARHPGPLARPAAGLRA